MKIRIDLKIFIFLIIFYFTNQIRSYLIIMFFCMIHEIGHIISGLILKIRPQKIEIMPFGFSSAFYNFNMKNNKNFKKEEIVIILAGPVVSFVLVILSNYIDLIYITQQEAIYSNLLILLFNLIPIYPLDGGRIIKNLICLKFGEEQANNLANKVSKITMIILTIISSFAVYYFKNLAIFLICIFLWSIVTLEKNDKTLAILPGK